MVLSAQKTVATFQQAVSTLHT